jgi:(S)-2-hydroxy-acid oxidase
LRRNESDFDEIKLNPRILVDVSKVSLKTKILGKYIDLPFGFAPSAMHKLV